MNASPTPRRLAVRRDLIVSLLLIGAVLVALQIAPTGPLPEPEPESPAYEARDDGIAAITHVTDILARGDFWLLSTYDTVGLWYSPDAALSWQPVEGSDAATYTLGRSSPDFWAGTTSGLRSAGARVGESVTDPLPPAPAVALATDDDGLYIAYLPPALWRFGPADRFTELQLPEPLRDPLTPLVTLSARGDWLLAGSSGAGAWQSHDRGRSWRPIALDPEGYVHEVQIASEREAWLRAREGLWRSEDRGASWLPVGVEGVTAMLVEEDAVTLGTGNGRVLSRGPAGIEWRLLDEGMNPRLPVLTLARDGQGALLAGMQDGLWRHGPDGRWHRIDGPGTRPIAALARLAGGTLLAGHRDGLYRSTDAGESWTLVPIGGASVVALAPDPDDPDGVWLGTDGLGVWRSDDGGATWRALEPRDPSIPFVTGLAAEPDGRLLARAAYERAYEWGDSPPGWLPRWDGVDTVAEFFTLVTDPHEPGRLWAGAADGLLTSDPGAIRWRRVAPELGEQSVLAIRPDPRVPDTLWIGATRGLYRLRAGRLEPTPLQGVSIRAIATGPRGEIAAGSEFHGLFVSTDGATWQPVPGLEARTITGLIATDAEFWVASDDGVGRVPLPLPDAPPAPTPLPATSSGHARARVEEPGARPPLFAHLLDPSVALIEEAARLGFEGVVMLLPWRDIEPNPDEWHFERADRWVEATEFYGLELVVRLDQSPGWAARQGSDSGLLNPLPGRWSDYADYAARVAARYRGRVRGYVLWNEPNLALDWGGEPPSPEGYIDLLRAAAPAIRAADPDAVVAAGALAPTTRDDATATDDLRYLDALLAAGAATSFDALALHPYPFGLPPDAPPDANGGLNLARIDRVRETLARHGLNDLPLWVTEFGYSTRPGDFGTAIAPDQRASYLEGAIERLVRTPGVELVALWNLSGSLDPTDEKAGFNLRDDPAALDVVRAATGVGDASPPAPGAWPYLPVALAADVRVHLGDSELPPPWWPLYLGRRPALRWEGGFFLASVPNTPQEIVLELFQPNERGNTLYLNGTSIGTIPITDFTGKWVTLRLPVPPDRLRVGYNTLTLEVAPLLPTFHQPGFVWEDLMIRHVRLEPYVTR